MYYYEILLFLPKVLFKDADRLYIGGIMSEIKTHPFQRTLGLGPYKLVGFFALVLPSESNQGRNNFHLAPKVERGIGTCAHCSHAITNIYIVQIGDGRRFGVGCDCILKVDMPVSELSKLKKIEREQAKIKRANLKAKKGLAARNELRQLMESHSDSMKLLSYNENRSLYQYATFCLDRSSDGGILIALNKVKKMLEAI